MRKLGIAMLSAWLASCAVGPDYERPESPSPQEYGERAIVPNAEARAIDIEWWKQFGDPTLDALIVDAIGANRDLRAATARLKAARAQRSERLFDFLPTVRAFGDYVETKNSSALRTPGNAQPRESAYYEAGFDATWELDLFGRVRRANESALAAAQASEAARSDVVLSVIAEVARNYLELRGAQSRLEVARRNAENQQGALDLVQARLDAGRGTGLDTARAQAQLSTTLAIIPPLEAEVGRAIRRIEVLTGNVPGTRTEQLATSQALPRLPEQLALGTPEDLLRRRPDVRTSERLLAASTASVGIAVGDLFPRVTFNGTYSWAATRVGDLDGRGNDGYFFGPSISWAAFDLGRVRQQVKAARADTEAALADYEQVVLGALEETENALSDYGRERVRYGHLDRAASASAEAAMLASQRFEGGVSDFLTVLDANRAQLEAEDQRAASATRAATNLVALYKALGGGWETAPAP